MSWLRNVQNYCFNLFSALSPIEKKVKIRNLQKSLLGDYSLAPMR